MSDKPEALRLAEILDGGSHQFNSEAAMELRRLHADCKHLRYERDYARAQSERCAKILIGIHNLTYPPKYTAPNGVVFSFRPENLDPHALMQQLSDRIRAIPCEIDDAMKASQP